MTRPKKPKAPRRTVEPEAGKKHSDLLPKDRQAKLGAKYVCFSCGARFYDLNKPEPLCPKCGADQRTRPKATEAPTPAPAPKKAPARSMPLIDDDETEAVPFEEDMEIEIEGLEGDDDLFEEGEGEAPEGQEDEAEES
ncbi:MAG: FYDLN acid domain-containing protein [Deltaproteobacteria bacterium]|nr:FYDLN acid domain-containing protein [Deltaproteobacteria bacterium]